MAGKKGQICRRGNFLWPATDRPLRVRRRFGDPPPKIELICDEEIGEAIKLVLNYQFATLQDALATQVSRTFGIQATSSGTFERIEKVIRKLIRSGVLKEMPNGMIDLADR